MIKKLVIGFIIGFILMTMARHAFAGQQPSCQGVISATQASTEQILCGNRLIMVNDGPQEAYFRLNHRGVNASTSDIFIESGDFIALDSTDQFDSVQIICQTGETAEVRFISWK